MKARPLSQTEFIALVAMLTGTTAFSIDALIPALPAMAREFGAGDASDAHMVILALVIGMGLGTFVVGPLSDAFGRKPVMLGGAALFAGASVAATFMPSMQAVIAMRLIQGLGAAAPRVVAIALIRDSYGGREMARILSLIMIAFALIPALAPMIGAGLAALAGWRGVFWAFALFSGVSALWLALRQPETLTPAARRPLRWGLMRTAVAEVARHSSVRRAILTQIGVMAMLFSVLTGMQPVFELSFGRGSSFVFWVAGIAVIAGGGSLLNARLVERLGMLWLIRRTLAVQLVVALGATAVWLADPATGQFAVFVLLLAASFSGIGLTMGNLNALAMQPLGHLAGLAASTVAAMTTLFGGLLAGLAGLWFGGAPLPMTLAVVVFTATAFLLSLRLEEEPA